MQTSASIFRLAGAGRDAVWDLAVEDGTLELASNQLWWLTELQSSKQQGEEATGRNLTECLTSIHMCTHGTYSKCHT